MPQHPLETYLLDLRQSRSVGTPETSGYPALRQLLNAVGEALRPKVICVVHPQNRGAGLPDGGLFEQNQLRAFAGDPRQVTLDAAALPARGALEVKGTAESVTAVGAGGQAGRYLDEYRQLLVTNYREFALFERAADGSAVEVERFTIADADDVFWKKARAARTTARDLGPGLFEFLGRVLRRPVPLREPGDVAWFLASYARDALRVLESAGPLPGLDSTRETLEQTLGLKFTGAKGRHFFRSTLVQTLFYGVFSAWVLWCRSNPPAGARFNWREAAWQLRVPVIRALFEQVAAPSRLGPLRLEPLLERAGEVLNRVDRGAFFDRFQQEQAVQYFYEPFLEQFDPALRKELGVWYTPPEVVRYMVARVDRTLRDELGIIDGLADERVVVLDPCCGTGAFLIETLRVIDRTLKRRSAAGDALAGQELRRAATERVFGFELLPAPLVVAHLQLGVLLRDSGAALGPDERAGVYLTNALTGWGSDHAPPLRDEFGEENAAAGRVKREQPVLVILGNPPYNGVAGLDHTAEERDLSLAYKTTNRVAKPQGQGLNDLYTRFFRMAERKIAELPPRRGVVCFVTNFSWLDSLSHPGMRERFLDAFDTITVDCLNGDKYRTGKLAPDGRPDPSVFSTRANREGIQVGAAVTTLVRRDEDRPAGAAAAVRFRHLWGADKLARLDALAAAPDDADYESFVPALELNLMLRPSSELHPGYLTWPALPDLFPQAWPGIKTSRDPLVVDIDRERLVERMTQYFDPEVTDAEMAELCPVAMTSGKRFDASATRRTLLRAGIEVATFRRYAYRPFDTRWLCYVPVTKLLDEKRADLVPQALDGNPFFAAAQQNRKPFDPPVVTPHLGSLHLIERGANLYPMLLNDAAGDAAMVDPSRPRHAGGMLFNLTRPAGRYLDGVLAVDPSDLFYHAIAVQHAPQYRRENDAALRQNWPRLPLPRDREALLDSAELGRRVAALLDADRPVEGVTSGDVRAELLPVGVLTRLDGGDGPLPATALAVTANWGNRDKAGSIMPARGRLVQRPRAEAEQAVLPADAADLLGDEVVDVYLNDAACWRGVPLKAWAYRLGGYAVLKKWLSYREADLLGRPLGFEEARHFRDTARRICALLLLGPALDASYRHCADSAMPWPPQQANR